MPEFRKDPVVERWVIIARERAKRPQHKPDRSHPAEPESCPFCAGNERMTPPAVLNLAQDDASMNEAAWSVRVVPNKYPALINHEDSTPRSDGLYHSMNATGVHEVVIETPRHVTDFATLGETEIERVLHAYQQRMRDLRGDPRWHYALIYKNQGILAGATLLHAHSQITALPMVPKEPLEELKAAKRHYATTARCLYCDIAQRESEAGTRIVDENKEFIVFCPFASRVAGETWVMPRYHAARFEAVTSSDLRVLARSIRAAMMRLSKRFHEPAFNYFLHSNPLQQPENPYYHWHLEILPKLQYVAGFEWGSGFYMNSLPPEEAARLLRNVVV
jgi:UDPglucose--hexose-1-phosphate uridylyltransferase